MGLGCCDRDMRLHSCADCCAGGADMSDDLDAISAKINTLKGQYKTECRKEEKSGAPKSKWQYLAMCHSVWRKDPTVRPPHTIKTSSSGSPQLAAPLSLVLFPPSLLARFTF